MKYGAWDYRDIRNFYTDHEISRSERNDMNIRISHLYCFNMHKIVRDTFFGHRTLQTCIRHQGRRLELDDCVSCV